MGVVSNGVTVCLPFPANWLLLRQTPAPPSPFYSCPPLTSQREWLNTLTPFTSASFISPANPFFPLLQQNPFFQELHTVTLTLALPFLCSPSLDQPEVPASRQRNATPPLHVVEARNARGILEDGASHNLTTSFCRTKSSDESDKYTQWDDFIGDQLTLNSKTGTLKMTSSLLPTWMNQLIQHPHVVTVTWLCPIKLML